MPIKPLPSQTALRETFDYDEFSGILKWRKSRPGLRRDMVAGTPTKNGYLQIRFDGGLYYAHRLIWKYMTGKDPVDQIDHVDCVRTNNAFANLREADKSKNMMNAGLRQSNTSGAKCVQWDGRRSKWVVSLKAMTKYHYIGAFDSFDDAVVQMEIARERLHGEFARAA